MQRQVRYPAPGSDVPGAPPPLRRPLTPDDGILDPSEAKPAEPTEPTGPTNPAPSPSRPAAYAETEAVPRAALWCAAALGGVAVGLELAGLLRHRRVRRQPALRRAELSG